MKSVKKWAMGVVAFLLVLVLGMGISYSSLKAGYTKVIKIAYMNGYVDAVRQDPETIEKLKADAGLLRTTVESRSDDYLEKVSRLNK